MIDPLKLPVQLYKLRTGETVMAFFETVEDIDTAKGDMRSHITYRPLVFRGSSIERWIPGLCDYEHRSYPIPHIDIICYFEEDVINPSYVSRFKSYWGLEG